MNTDITWLIPISLVLIAFECDFPTIIMTVLGLALVYVIIKPMTKKPSNVDLIKKKLNNRKRSRFSWNNGVSDFFEDYGYGYDDDYGDDD